MTENKIQPLFERSKADPALLDSLLKDRDTLTEVVTACVAGEEAACKLVCNLCSRPEAENVRRLCIEEDVIGECVKAPTKARVSLLRALITGNEKCGEMLYEELGGSPEKLYWLLSSTGTRGDRAWLFLLNFGHLWKCYPDGLPVLLYLTLANDIGNSGAAPGEEVDVSHFAVMLLTETLQDRLSDIVKSWIRLTPEDLQDFIMRAYADTDTFQGSAEGPVNVRSMPSQATVISFLLHILEQVVNRENYEKVADCVATLLVMAYAYFEAVCHLPQQGLNAMVQDHREELGPLADAYYEVFDDPQGPAEVYAQVMTDLLALANHLALSEHRDRDRISPLETAGIFFSLGILRGVHFVRFPQLLGEDDMTLPDTVRPDDVYKSSRSEAFKFICDHIPAATILRLIANCLANSPAAQDYLINCDERLIPTLLSHCIVDPRVPLLREGAVFAVECATAGNLEMQKVIGDSLGKGEKKNWATREHMRFVEAPITKKNTEDQDT
ncbi:hypothetical protein FOZ61_005391 [Perkinsus olseni]|uniref:Ataxin-10 domain-containing protein n=1 Tax=Perkinsus olseni TaxID=32597 RepID=A0A7J6MHW4_PEROL|nr:hypothetical protein FOZ61_005391 [Perkinsus olseni]KAF4676578.1 hypothetical protein FOL46_000040 [Perkinsus olseni]